MITTTLLLSFSFFSLLMLFFGMYFNSRVFFIVGGTFFVFLGLLGFIGGVYEYNGTVNSTYTLTADNASITAQSQIPNYNVVNNYAMQYFSSAYILVGLISIYYGVTHRQFREAIIEE